MAARQVRKGDLVLVVWRDAFDHREVDDISTVKDDCVWETVGWAERLDEKYLHVASGRERTTHGNLAWVQSIPRGFVLELYVLPSKSRARLGGRIDP